jgi:hypothetical protein
LLYLTELRRLDRQFERRRYSENLRQYLSLIDLIPHGRYRIE